MTGERKTKYRTNRVLRLSAILFTLVMITWCLLSGMMARYTEVGSSDDGARVAKFEVKGTADLNTDTPIKLKPGDNHTIIIDISNNSEVAVAYTVTVTSSVLPLKFNFDSVDIQGSGSFSSEQYNMDANDSKEHTLTVYWPADQNSESDLTYMGKTDALKISVKSVQID